MDQWLVDVRRKISSLDFSPVIGRPNPQLGWNVGDRLLLHGVDKLVGEKSTSGRRSGGRASSTEDDVVADRIRKRTD